MKLIRNNIFRICLYILGYVAAVLICVSTMITFFRYTLFNGTEDFSKPYAISDSVVEGVKADLTFQQEQAASLKNSAEIKLGEKQIDIVDYADIEEQLRTPVTEGKDVIRIDDLTETMNAEELIGPDMNTQLKDYSEGIKYGPNIYNSYNASIPYNSSKNGNVRFLRMTWSDYLEIVRDNCEKYNYNEYSDYNSSYSITYDVDAGEYYDEYGNQIAEDPAYEYEIEDDPAAEEETVVQSVMIVSDYNGLMLGDYLAETLTEGDYFKMIDGKLFYYSPAYELINYDKYGTAMTSAIASGDYVYFLITNDMLDIIYGSDYSEMYTPEEQFENKILSSYIYRCEEEAVYSTLDEETRDIFTSYLHDGYYNIFGSDTAYSLDGEELTGTNIFSNDNELYSHSLSSSFNDYANILETKSDVFIKYDKESGKLTQWYRDKNGEPVNYEYLSDTDLTNLLIEIDEDFVLGLNLKGVGSVHVEDKFAYEVAGRLPQPALILCFSALIFLAVIVLLTIAEPPRLLLVDRAPYLVWIILYAAVIILFGILAELMAHNDVFLLEFVRNIVSIMGLMLVIALVLYLATAALWMTVVRRVKAKKFLDGFIIFKIVRWIYKGIGKAAHKFPGKLRGFVGLIAFTIVNTAFILLAGFNSYEEIVAVLAIALAIIGVVVMIYLLRYMTDMEKLLNTARRLEAGELDAKVDPDSLHLNAREMGDSLNNLGAGLQKAVDASLRDERTKAELITNVSHDIKTPLTSIISYIDLLKREDIENEKALEYIEVLDNKSERLKQLILDLIEASKTSTGNIELECMNLSLTELLNQCLGEHEENMNELGLEVVKTFAAEESLIYADGRRVFRVIDNLLNNVEKYAQPNTRVFIDMKNEYEEVEGAEGTERKGKVICTIKNTSKEMLNISADELMERFVRGDRSRNTEGSGLGLSIARNLTELQNGTFDISIDGDHFKVDITFPLVKRESEEVEDSSEEELIDASEESVTEKSISEENLAKESLTEEKSEAASDETVSEESASDENPETELIG